jgi:hypothetical protein
LPAFQKSFKSSSANKLDLKKTTMRHHVTERGSLGPREKRPNRDVEGARARRRCVCATSDMIDK